MAACDRGLLLPGTFLDLAEQTGLIVPIGEWVLSEACRDVRAWNQHRDAEQQIALSVNLSARQLAEPELSRRVKAIVEGSGVTADSLHLSLEVTETLLPVDQEAASTGAWPASTHWASSSPSTTSGPATRR